MSSAVIVALVVVAVEVAAMPQPWGSLYRRDHVLVLGAPGSGKSPFAAELVEGGPLAARFGLGEPARRVVYFDATRGEWAKHGERVAPDDLAASPELLAGRYLRLVVVPDDLTLVADFATTLTACRAAHSHGGLVLVVDEVGDLCHAGGGATAELLALHRNGHHDGVASVLASPCWTDVPARCRSTASRVFSFFQRADGDVRTLNAELGRQVPGFGDLAAAWKYPAPPVAWTSPTLHG